MLSIARTIVGRPYAISAIMVACWLAGVWAQRAGLRDVSAAFGLLVFEAMVVWHFAVSSVVRSSAMPDQKPLHRTPLVFPFAICALTLPILTWQATSGLSEWIRMAGFLVAILSYFWCAQVTSVELARWSNPRTLANFIPLFFAGLVPILGVWLLNGRVALVRGYPGKSDTEV